MQLLASTKDYKLYNISSDNKIGLRVVSQKSNNSSDHFQINIISQSSRSSRPISRPDIPTIVSRFYSVGPTLAFDIYSDTQTESKLHSIVHADTNQEQSFTSTGSKLDYHWPIFKKLADTGYGSIIRATLTLHQRCSSRCAFCSTINRSNADSISLDEAIEFVDKLYFRQAEYNSTHFPTYNSTYQDLTGSPIRLRSIILSGGGQPNLWPHFSDLVAYLSTLDIDLGLITNGFPSHIDESIYSHFKWIRLSITPPEASPHYIDGKFENQYLPESLFSDDTTLGCSYVYGPWAESDIYKRLDAFAVAHNLDYVRLLCDCNLPRDRQLQSHSELANKLLENGLIDSDGRPLSKIFHQLKYHMKSSEAAQIWDSGTCFLQSYNVFWDTSGHDDNGSSYCYPCDSVTVLAEENTTNIQPERGFNSEKWGTVPNTEISRLYEEKWRPFFDPRQNCSACLFHQNNKKVKSLVSNFTSDPSHIPVSDQATLQHVNFP